ncbi:MAG: thioredoxin domain-containing protein, partial [Candidatus Abyssubacteria bacterium]|nr:thioredoxin domain-containing protein [Candidatus Abyssubacteria bacterium]
MEKIKWLDWSPAAFDRAQREDKLVLLDIGAVWCHWCHVMDEESYSDPDIVKTINERFVPVRVDNDERPDVNERYNQGGWPTTVVLTPEGLVVYGVTYLPPSNMKELLKKTRQWYDRHKEKVVEAGQEARIEMADGVTRPLAPAGPVKDFSGAIIEDIMKNADPVHGGFGTGAKFPHAGAIELAFAEHHAGGDGDILEFAEKTLRTMAKGLLDAEEGGLFRYSVAREWNVPHYEKNLDINAACLRNFIDAYRITGKKEYADMAESII